MTIVCFRCSDFGVRDLDIVVLGDLPKDVGSVSVFSGESEVFRRINISGGHFVQLRVDLFLWKLAEELLKIALVGLFEDEGIDTI